MRSFIASASEEAAIDDLMLMPTDEATNLRYELKTNVLFNQLLRLKEMSKRMIDVAKELKVYHGIMSDSAPTASQKKLR